MLVDVGLHKRGGSTLRLNFDDQNLKCLFAFSRLSGSNMPRTFTSLKAVIVPSTGFLKNRIRRYRT